jgi:hypothetical protein
VLDRIYGVGLSEVLTFTVPAGQRRVAEPHAAGVEEHIVATHGRLTVGPLTAPVMLEPGDLLVFARRRPARLRGGRGGSPGARDHDVPAPTLNGVSSSSADGR